MSEEIYRAKIINVGEFISEFTSEGVLVFFAATAPEELQDFALVHDRTTPQARDVKPGDKIKLGDIDLPVLAVGKVANENLRNLGHVVIKFNGSNTPEMDGDITVPVAKIPELRTGMELIIYS